MDQLELETYQLQLSQVEETLTVDPDNTELQNLVKELKELIELAEQQLKASKPEPSRRQSATTAVSGANAKAWAAGDECLARYSSDGQWYAARITSVGGASDNPVFSIVFKKYNSTELLKSGDIKPLPQSYQAGGSAGSSYGAGAGGGSGVGGKRKLSKEEEDERERKKKRNESKLKVREQKAREQNEKKATWQKFAKKAEKKHIQIAGVAGTSIFKTPDNPYGKGGGAVVRMCISRSWAGHFTDILFFFLPQSVSLEVGRA